LGVDKFIKSKTFLSPANLMGSDLNKGSNGGKNSPRRSSASYHDRNTMKKN